MTEQMNDAGFSRVVADAVLGIDTLCGDVRNPSGTGRFIADSWFSDQPLPPAYTHPAASRIRVSGGVAARPPDREAIDQYRGGSELVARLRREHPDRRVLPALYGCRGLVDVTTVEAVIGPAREGRG